MTLEIVPFTSEHWAAAAELLAASHGALRLREPRLSPRYEDVETARAVIKATCGSGSGVAASRDGRVVGYLVALMEMDAMERVAAVLPSGAAVAAGEDTELLREMYAAAAQRWVRAGYFVHYAHVAFADSEAVQTWNSLGFGAYSLYNWRELTPVAGPEADLVIRRVRGDRFDDQEKLREGLRRYNTTSPILHSLVRPGDLRAILDAERERMEDDRHAYFIAYERDEPVGLMIFAPPEPDYTLTPEGCVYLHIAFVDEGARAGGVGAAMVNHGFAWAREQGYQLCTVGYFAPNLLGARFWQAKGFMSLGYTLERRLDERIAWATGEHA